jgi:nucleoside-diphosphate-sugar epimerase
VNRSDGFDVGNRECFASLESDYTYVINLAAIIQITEDNIEEATRVNGLGALTAAMFAQSTDAMFINASTISALPCCDNDYCKSYYATTKRLGDNLIIKYCENNSMEYSILRFSQLYDTETDAKKYQPMLYRIIQQIKQDRCVTLYGDNNPARNYLHVDDAAKAISIDLNNRLPGIWNCIHPSSNSVLSLVKTVSDTMNIPAEIVRLKHKSELHHLQIPDQNLFHQRCPEWQPRSLATGIKGIVDHV